MCLLNVSKGEGVRTLAVECNVLTRPTKTPPLEKSPINFNFKLRCFVFVSRDVFWIRQLNHSQQLVCWLLRYWFFVAAAARRTCRDAARCTHFFHCSCFGSFEDFKIDVSRCNSLIHDLLSDLCDTSLLTCGARWAHLLCSNRRASSSIFSKIYFYN